ncbi:amino acid/polyamine transporter I [Lophiotrema nucula]|uniref:Amino acid/polyamine transporter I n=1 Tax=Lophiotrema nucula TaxID=690887 RepID=A0A6A5Z767_9PLEO|nr:amino acid/polyamine transporter I [Lophiotrema nucula]
MKQSPKVESKASMSVGDADARKLQEMGYAQEMGRKFSVWSVLGVGFSLTNSWWAVSAAMITGINSGGPVLLIYGTILLFIISLGVAGSLSELVSALPNAAGQSFWARELAPKKYAAAASYLAGWFAWAGSLFACASVSLSVAYALVACYSLSHPDYVYTVYHVFAAYQCVNVFSAIFNCYGKLLPQIATVSLYTTLVSFIIVLITVPAKAPTHRDARFVFETLMNNTGWSTNGIAFIVGLINTNWGFSCLDTAVHLAEEVPQPERNIPIAIMGTVIIGFVTSFAFIISMMFSLLNFDAVSVSLAPILELFYDALGNKAGAIVLESLVIATGIGCQIACHTWQSRLCWSFSRDRGLPFHRLWAQIHPTLDVPLYAHALGCFLNAVLGCLYLASYSAINSIITGCIVLPYVSYAIPVICLLVRGRDKIRPGPFWLGKYGYIANFVLLGWTLFTVVMYSLPAYMPAEADSMNYVSACYGILVLVFSVDWFVRGRKEYRGQTLEHDDGLHTIVGL